MPLRLLPGLKRTDARQTRATGLPLLPPCLAVAQRCSAKRRRQREGAFFRAFPQKAGCAAQSWVLLLPPCWGCSPRVTCWSNPRKQDWAVKTLFSVLPHPKRTVRNAGACVQKVAPAARACRQPSRPGAPRKGSHPPEWLPAPWPHPLLACLQASEPTGAQQSQGWLGSCGLGKQLSLRGGKSFKQRDLCLLLTKVVLQLKWGKAGLKTPFVVVFVQRLSCRSCQCCVGTATLSVDVRALMRAGSYLQVFLRWQF